MRFPIHLSKDRVVCEDLSLKNYKEILKISYGDEPSREVFVETLTSLLAEVSDKPKQFFETLNVFDLFVLLISLRIQTMGDVVSVSLKGQENTSLELRLDWIKESLLSFSQQFDNQLISHPEFDAGVVVGFPGVDRLMEPSSEELFNFIKGVSRGGVEYQIEKNSTAKEVFEKLPAKLGASVMVYFQQLAETLTKTNLLERYNLQQQTLIIIPTIDSLLWFTKIMFNESIETFYENLFYLAYHGKMDSSYLESCTPGEYIYYAKLMQKTLQQRQSEQGDAEGAPNYGDNFLPEDLQDGP